MLFVDELSSFPFVCFFISFFLQAVLVFRGVSGVFVGVLSQRILSLCT